MPSITPRLQTRIELAPSVSPPPAAVTAAPDRGLGWLECVGAIGVFVGWLFIFGGGIIIDTTPYRNAIAAYASPAAASAESAAATEVVRQTGGEAGGAAGAVSAGTAATDDPSGGAAAGGAATTPKGNLAIWLGVVILWYLPLNLALLCAISGTLGAFGSRANLHDDDYGELARDDTNPYISALLRGFFIYLIMISGLLMIDDTPFLEPTAAQYIRLAGLMSLFSFVVNYHPSAFSRLLMLAANRMHHSDRDQHRSGAESNRAEVTVERAATTHTRIHASAASTSAPQEDQEQLGNLLGEAAAMGAAGENGRLSASGREEPSS